MEMYPNGVKITGTPTIKVHHKTVQCGKEANRLFVLCAAVPGATFLKASVQPPASGAVPTSMLPSSASVLLGRSYLLIPNLIMC